MCLVHACYSVSKCYVQDATFWQEARQQPAMLAVARTAQAVAQSLLAAAAAALLPVPAVCPLNLASALLFCITNR